MTPTLPPFPESALRAVLARFAAAWARASSPPAEPGEDDSDRERKRLVYVDAFAGAELQFGTGAGRESGEETRAAAVVRALGEDAVVVLVEEDPAYLDRVREDLERIGAGGRIRPGGSLLARGPGEFAQVEADFGEAAAEVTRAAEDLAALFWVAPPAARKLPWSVLQPLFGLPGADVLVRVPHVDFEKQGRHTGPLADLPGFARRIVEGASAMLDDPKHAWLPAWRAAEREGGFPRALAGVMDRYRERIAAVAGERTVKPVALEAKGGASAHLLLAAGDPALALSLEAPAPGAKPAGRAAKTRPAAPVVPSAPEPPPPPAAEGEVLDLFPDLAPPPPEPVAPRVDFAAVAEAVHGRFGGRAATWNQVLAAFAATELTPDDLKRALGVLKRGGRAVYRTISDPESSIDFPTEAVPQAPKRRKRRGSGEVGLFGDDSEE